MTEETKAGILLHLSAMAFNRNEWAIGWLERIDKAEDKDAVWVEFVAEATQKLAGHEQAQREWMAAMVAAVDGIVNVFDRALTRQRQETP